MTQIGKIEEEEEEDTTRIEFMTGRILI